MVSTGGAWGEVVAQLALGQTKSSGRHQKSGNESATGHLLTIATVALEHHDRFGRTFVANCSAKTTTHEGNFQVHIVAREFIAHASISTLVAFICFNHVLACVKIGASESPEVAPCNSMMLRPRIADF